MAQTEPCQLGRYQLYKQGTKKIVDWLIQTAGRSVDISPFLLPDKTKTCNKIKPRALVALAEAIVSAQRTSASPLITVTIIELVWEVIEGRQASAEWYAIQPAASTEAESANDTHKFFIGVLRDVHRILTSNQPPEIPDLAKDRLKAKKPARKNLENDLNNLFLKLELEEPSDSPLGHAPPSQSVRSRPDPSPTEVTLDTENENEAFALWCHLEDLRDVRHYVQDIWSEYSNGDVSLLTATMVTETAFGLMRIANERFVQMYQAFDDWWHLATFLCFRLTRNDAKTATFGPSESGLSRSTAERMNLVDLIHPAAVFGLQDLAADVKEILATHAAGKLMAMRQVLTPVCYDISFILRVNAVQLAGFVDMYREERESLPRHQSQQSHVRTEFVMGIHDYIVDGRMPLWLVCAYQMYYDLYLVIGSGPWCASEEYLTKLSQMDTQVEAFRPWRVRLHKLKHGMWPAVDGVLKEKKLHEPLMRVTEETIKLFKQHLTGDNHEAVLRPHLGMPINSLLGMPCSAGKHLYQAKLFFHHAGVNNMNQHIVCLAMAHLYTAARRYGLVNIWQDMELVLSQQNKSNPPLVLKQNKNGDAFTPLRHYLICLGVPATEFARGRIPKPPKDSDISDKCRKVQVTSAYMSALINDHSSLDRLGFSRGDITENILDHLTSVASGKLPKGQGGEFSTQHSLLQLLSTFKNEMIRDEPYLNFNFLGFWAICFDLFEKVARGLEKMDPSSCESTGEFKPWAIVYYLLEDVARASSQSKSLLFSKMGLAACVLDSYIVAQGNRCSLDAFNQSSGRIPKHLRPRLVKLSETQKGVAKNGPGRPIPSKSAGGAGQTDSGA